MKLRIRGNSLRLRLKRGEVDRLAAGTTLVEETQFPGSKLRYSLGLSDSDDMLASFDNGSIAISMPREIIPEWADTDLVSLYSELVITGIAKTTPILTHILVVQQVWFDGFRAPQMILAYRCEIAFLVVLTILHSQQRCFQAGLPVIFALRHAVRHFHRA